MIVFDADKSLYSDHCYHCLSYLSLLTKSSSAQSSSAPALVRLYCLLSSLFWIQSSRHLLEQHQYFSGTRLSTTLTNNTGLIHSISSVGLQFPQQISEAFDQHYSNVFDALQRRFNVGLHTTKELEISLIVFSFL